MISRYQNNKSKRDIFILFAISFAIMFMIMSLMHVLKYRLFADITKWESDLISIIISSVMAVLIALFIFRNQQKYHSQLLREIEKREKLEKEIGESLSIIDAAFDATEDGILIVSREGKVSKSNKKFLELWKIPLSFMESNDDATLIGYVIDQLKNADLFLEKIQALYSKPLEESFDELHFNDGRIFERYSKPQIAGNDVIGRVWSFRDVTDKRRAEERIKLFEHTIASIKEAVNITDLDDNLVYVNQAFCDTYGYKEEEIIGKHISILFASKTPKNILQEIRPDTLNTGWSGEIDNKRKDGKDFPIYLSTSVIRDHNNKPIALVGVARDISDRKKEEIINNVLYKISQAVQGADSLEVLFKEIHEILKDLMPVNNFYLSLKDDQTDNTSYPYFIDETDLHTEPEKPAKGCTEYVLRLGAASLIDKDRFNELSTSGEIQIKGIPAAVWLGIPLKVFNNTIGVMAVQDYNDPTAYGDIEKEILTIVSEQIAAAIYKKRTEYQLMAYTLELQTLNDLLSESERNLKELNTSKDKFFSIISHDLKGPYQGLLSILDLLIKEYDLLDDEEKKDIFIKIRDNSQRTYNLLDNLLQWSRMQTGKVKFHPEKINLLKVSAGIIDLFCDSANVKGISIKNTVSEDIFLFADPNMIQLVIRNLLSNAIKFSFPESEIILSAIISNGHVEVSVKDSGVGMDIEKARDLFRIDIQNSTLGTAKETGTGLGLLLCKDMVNLHMGTIWSISAEGKGSTFTFSIPLL